MQKVPLHGIKFIKITQESGDFKGECFTAQFSFLKTEILLPGFPGCPLL
jgi:hypothetical protein